MAAAVVVTLVLVLPGGGGGGGAGPTDATGTNTTGTAAAKITADTMKDSGACPDGCYITGQVVFTHPQWGKVTLVTAQGTKDASAPKTAYLAIFDTSRALKWQNTTGPLYSLKPISDPVDSLTHIFLTYNPGRADGVIVLSADNSSLGMTDYATIPVGDDPSVYRFYGAKAQTGTGGQYSIVKSSNDCSPDCAGGTVTNTTYTWNGSDYAAS